jgi:hypothetical protein
MKLLRILGVFLAITLFAGCEVWISFWGDADGSRDIFVQVSYPYAESIGDGEYIYAKLYQRISGVYQNTATLRGADGAESLSGEFQNLSSGLFKVTVWKDESAGGTPEFPNYGAEDGFTTNPIDLSAFVDYTVYATTESAWKQDGTRKVTAP